MFNNPRYVILDDELKLFKKFLDGGSRQYPSDGNIPCDIVAGEVRKILNNIIEIANNPNDKFHKDAQEVLKSGKHNLVRGAIKLYLAKYTTRDWRRKRFTDDIDLWIYKMDLIEHILKKNAWIRKAETKEWEKQIQWHNYITNETKTEVLIAANDINLLLDFGAGAYLEGTSLTEVFRKKVKRGHDVDISDLINVAMVKGCNDRHRGEKMREEEWNKAWITFEEAVNIRSTRITSNLISLCRYSYAIADHLERVGRSIEKYHEIIFDKTKFPDRVLDKYCRTSIHWINFLATHGPDETRKMIHEFLLKQRDSKPLHAKNLRAFADKVLNLLNSKYKYLKVVFEIEK